MMAKNNLADVISSDLYKVRTNLYELDESLIKTEGNIEHESTHIGTILVDWIHNKKKKKAVLARIKKNREEVKRIIFYLDELIPKVRDDVGDIYNFSEKWEENIRNNPELHLLRKALLQSVVFDSYHSTSIVITAMKYALRIKNVGFIGFRLAFIAKLFREGFTRVTVRGLVINIGVILLLEAAVLLLQEIDRNEFFTEINDKLSDLEKKLAAISNSIAEVSNLIHNAFEDVADALAGAGFVFERDSVQGIKRALKEYEKDEMSWSYALNYMEDMIESESRQKPSLEIVVSSAARCASIFLKKTQLMKAHDSLEDKQKTLAVIYLLKHECYDEMSKLLSIESQKLEEILSFYILITNRFNGSQDVKPKNIVAKLREIDMKDDETSEIERILRQIQEEWMTELLEPAFVS